MVTLSASRVVNFRPVVNAFSSRLSSVNLFMKTYPRSTNTIFAVFTSLGADYVQQKNERKPRVDWVRSAVFLAFSVTVSQFGYFFYTVAFPRMFPGAIGFAQHATLRARLLDRQGQISVMKQNAADLLGYTPFVFLPIFYMYKGALQVDSSGDGAVSKGMTMYRQNFLADNGRAILFWTPANVIFFSVPLYLRMPVGHTLNFLFLWGLSAFRGAQTEVM